MAYGADPLLLQLFAIFVSAKVLGELFERLALPAVLGEILAGVALGPYAAALIIPGPTISSIAQVGAIFLLFTVGLATHPAELLHVGRHALGVALAGMTLPFIVGFGYMMLRGEQAHEATFVAAAMVATSVGITARVLADLKVLNSRAGRIILGAAVFDDILGMILLAVVVGLASAGGIKWLQLGVLSAEALAFALFMMLYAPRLMRRIHPRLERMSLPNAPLILALALCLGLSVAAEKIGLAAIIGAFFAGLAFADYAPEWNLRPRVNAINEFLAPYFFFVMGAQLNLTIFSRPVALQALIISLLAIVSKVVGGGLPVLRQGRKMALRVGVGMVPRGEVGLIVALIGLQMKLMSQPAYAYVLTMTAATTLIAPPWLRHLFREETQDGGRGS